MHEMLTVVRNLLSSARTANGPAIEKWQSIEQSAHFLVLLNVALVLFLVIKGQFLGSLAIFGGLLGVFVVGAYGAMFAGKTTLAFYLALLVAAVGAATAVGYATLPLWILLANGGFGATLVVGLVAMWTKRQPRGIGVTH